MYDFGYDTGEQTEVEEILNPESESGNSTIKALRAKAEADSKALKEMREQLTALQAENRQGKVAKMLESKGYPASAAGLYTGDLDKVNEWLDQYGSVLAKSGAPIEELTPESPAGPPTSTISPESQALHQQMQAAGSEGSAPLGSDKEIAAAFAAARSPEEFEKIAKASGWQYTTDGLWG